MILFCRSHWVIL